jgi:hypothetical protein
MPNIEDNQRFSESILWDLQTEAYTRFGPEAWASKGVPFYLTSNPLIARQFARMIESYFMECPRGDASEPIYLFDLGAGSGRLAFLMLKHLMPLKEKYPFVYVMTDMVEANLTYWQNHPLLMPYFEQGVLDCALYKHDQQEPIQLHVSRRTLERTSNPVVMICTYFFDTIPQDLFRVRNGSLEEGRVRITLPEDSAAERDPEWIEKLEASYTYQPIENSERYYSLDVSNEILKEYIGNFPDTIFLYPSGSLHSLEYFRKLSQQRMLLLAGDQGVSSEDQIRQWGEPEISRHSSFSVAVNYHALARYFELQDGLGFLTTCPHPKFAVIAGVLGEGIYNGTCKTFYREIDAFQPVDYWHLTSLTNEQCEMLSLHQLLVLIKLGNYDPLNLHCFFEAIRNKISSADLHGLELLKQIIHECLSNFYFVNPSEGDFVMNMGVLFFEMNDYTSAMHAFLKAVSIKGMDQQLLQNIAFCKVKLGRVIN